MCSIAFSEVGDFSTISSLIIVISLYFSFLLLLKDMYFISLVISFLDASIKYALAKKLIV